MRKTLKVWILALLMLSSVSVEAQVSRDTLDQNADQSQGNYAATNLNYLGSGSLGMMQSAWKDPLQHMGEGQSRPGYTKYYWTPELVLPVRIREGMYTLINFPSWEVIDVVYLGDDLSFKAEIQGPSSIMVYPEASQFVGVDTNMIVFGRSGNKYVFYVQSETVNTDRITNAIIDIEVVNKGKNAGGLGGNGNPSYGNGGYSKSGAGVDSLYTRNMQKEDWIENIPVDPTKFRFDIEVYVPNPDDIIIAPERVWRDNIFTYIDLGEKALTAVQRPIVTLIVERSETPVGFRAAGPNNRLIVVEGMGDMVLRSGKRIVCLKLRRADSDGLENAIYAKTNEWDLQTGYASNPTEGNVGNTADPYAGNGSNMNPEVEQLLNGSGSAPQNQNNGFFNENAFMNGNVNNNSNTGRSGSGINNGGSFNSIGNGNSQNTGGWGVPQQQSNGSGAPMLDSLPKVTPKTGGVELTGQYDVNVGSSELITPEYNGQDANVSVAFQSGNGQAASQGGSQPQAAGASPRIQNQTQNQTGYSTGLKNMGTSENNANPVLIAPRGNNSSISAETEALINEFRSGSVFGQNEESNISIELGTDENVNNLEKLWSDISKHYAAAVGRYQPFYSVDTPADGQGKEVFHLRVGPVSSLDEGDNVCSQLGRNGIFCSVVRIQ